MLCRYVCKAVNRFVFLCVPFCAAFGLLRSVATLAATPYISRVWEYNPAPGQFVNSMPSYEDGDDAEAMRAKAEKYICGTTRSAVSLGGWGGYVVLGFDHMVVNVAGAYDFQVWGNAFYADPNDPSLGGSAEPGVIYVSYDANEDGVPNDKWYEIAGSEYDNSTSNFKITYFRPTDHTPVPDPDEDITDLYYIFWRDKDGAEGYITKNKYHLQDYYPKWATADRLVYTGTLLPSNVEIIQDDEYNTYILHNFAFGYADNHPNDSTANKINIDWAVDKKGNPVHLPGIHFVKVQTGVNQQCGWIGETSTEVSGGEDLHPLAPVPTGNSLIHSEPEVRKVLYNEHIYIIINNQIKYVL